MIPTLRKNYIVPVVVFVFLFGSLAFSQEKEIEKRIFETSFTASPPAIDGSAGDSCWSLIEWSGDFTQTHPYDSTLPSQQTAFKILYDNNNLYVFIRAFDTEPDKISQILAPRDYFSGDFVQIFIDSDYDKNTAFAFSATASGAKGDEAVSLDGNRWDDSWNPVWYLKTSSDDKGWCAEFKIPFSQLRFGKKEVHIWGIQVSRRLYREEENSSWQYIPKGSPGFVHLFGELHGIKNIEPKKQREIVPYLVSKLYTFEKEEGNPFADGRDYGFSAGLDGKLGISNNFILDYTVNPDFGQVEADPSEVNLTAFESYFSERRPFFVEGKNIYEFRPASPIVFNNFGIDNLFYTRRIGRYPQYYPDVPEGEHVKMPDATTILGAFKLSGKTKDGLSIGVMESITANEMAEITDNDAIRKERVEPLTNYFVGRVQKDFNKGETVLGGIVTSVNRNITDTTLNYLHSQAYTGGIDFLHYWKKRTWYVSSTTIASQVKGDEEAILNTQKSSARYYQRPDAGHISLDSTLTSLNGYGTSFKLGRRGDKKIVFETSLTLRSPGTEFNDIGYMRNADFIHHGTWMGYYIRDPFLIFRDFYLNLNYFAYWNFEGELLSTAANMNFNTQFKNKWRLNGSFTRKNESKSPSFLYGGPMFINPGLFEWNLNASSDHSKKLQFYVGTYHGYGDSDSYTYHNVWGGVTYRPLNALTISIDPDYGTGNQQLQYVTRTEFEEGPRYIFAQLDQKTFSMGFRINFLLTPDLSFQYYGQPFISAGSYTSLKMITDPKAARYEDRFYVYSGDEITYDQEDRAYQIDENRDGTTDYTVGNPDFNFQQFRSNLVIRWEYRPGSTLYLVWSQGKTYSGTDSSFEFGQNMKNLFEVYPQNIFLIKLNYWFSL